MARDKKDLSYAPARPISSEGIRDKLGKVATGLADAGSSVGSFIVKSPKAIGSAVLGGAAGLVNIASQSDGMKSPESTQTASSLNDAIKGTLSQVPGTIGEGIKGLGKTIVDGARGPVSDMMLSASQRVSGGSGGLGASTGDASGVGANVVKPTLSSPNPIAPLESITPTSAQPQLGKVITPETINNPLSQSGSTLNINTPSGGQGSISFQDGRVLNDTQKTRLANDINYNSLQSTKDKFAREAEIVAQRRQNASDMMRFRSLPPQARAMAEANFQSDQGKIGAYNLASQSKALQAEVANRLGRDKLAMAAIKIQDQQDFDRQKLGQQSQGELVKLLSSPEGQSLGLKDKLAASRKMTGKVDINTFKMVHDQDFVNNALQSEDSLIQSLAQQGYPQEDALSVLDSWRQSERNK